MQKAPAHRCLEASFRVGAARYALIALVVPVFVFLSAFLLRDVNAQMSESRRTNLISLGERLFSDRRLSADGRVSCSTCHQPERLFSDGRKVGIGAHEKAGTRNVPSLINSAGAASFFWDGRGSDLERIVLEPFTNPVEHGLSTTQELMNRVRSNSGYVKRFSTTFGLSAGELRPTHVAQAIAAFVKTISDTDSPFDRFYYEQQSSVLNASALRGLQIFADRAQCTRCHVIRDRRRLMTDDQFHSVRVGFARIERKLPELVSAARTLDPARLGISVLSDHDIAALGRYVVTQKPADVAKFRTPSLRNVALTGPYMHDGSVSTLEEAINYELYRGVAEGRPILLTTEERSDLHEFLRSLTGARFSSVVRN